MFLQLAICVQTENLSLLSHRYLFLLIKHLRIKNYKEEIVVSKETRLRVLKTCKIDLENVSTLELAKT